MVCTVTHIIIRTKSKQLQTKKSFRTILIETKNSFSCSPSAHGAISMRSLCHRFTKLNFVILLFIPVLLKHTRKNIFNFGLCFYFLFCWNQVCNCEWSFRILDISLHGFFGALWFLVIVWMIFFLHITKKKKTKFWKVYSSFTRVKQSKQTTKTKNSNYDSTRFISNVNDCNVVKFITKLEMWKTFTGIERNKIEDKHCKSVYLYCMCVVCANGVNGRKNAN